MALIQTLVCDSCGATLKDYDPKSNTAKCPYCGAITTIVNEAPTINIGTSNPTVVMCNDGYYHPVDSYYIGYLGMKYYIDKFGNEHCFSPEYETYDQALAADEQKKKEKEEWERTHPEEVARRKAEQERREREAHTKYIKEVQQRQKEAEQERRAGCYMPILAIAFLLFLWWFILHISGSDPWQMEKKQSLFNDSSYSYDYNYNSNYQTNYIYEDSNYMDDDDRPDNTLRWDDYDHP